MTQKNLQYEMNIGLEVHMELSTRTKIFCGCSTAFGGTPNSHICPVCTGMPGTLPVLNRRVIDLAIAVGLAANCTIQSNCRFDRKNYFYPDNPQAYQISQLYAPICRDGYVEIQKKDGTTKRIRIHEIHMEEDAGKLVHDSIRKNSYIDYNRSGIPLIEIVSEPDMEDDEEVILYLEALRSIAQYTGASDCKLQEGSMRADINLSVRPAGTEHLGTRTETKNLSSFRAISHMIAHERNRQIVQLESGGIIRQETRHWNEDKMTSTAMRSKEDAQDYRYFPEPDLPPLFISEEWIARIRSRLPELQPAKKKRYMEEFRLPEYDASILTGTKRLADIFEETVQAGADPKKASNWLMGETLRLCREDSLDPADMELDGKKLASLICMVESGAVNQGIAKQIFEAVFQSGADPEHYAKEHDLLMVRDSAALDRTIDLVLETNTAVVQQYLDGKAKVTGYLIGQVMKQMKGKADPAEVNRALAEKLKSL